jgi:hypothetical protein
MVMWRKPDGRGAKQIPAHNEDGDTAQSSGATARWIRQHEQLLPVRAATSVSSEYCSARIPTGGATILTGGKRGADLQILARIVSVPSFPCRSSIRQRRTVHLSEVAPCI